MSWHQLPDSLKHRLGPGDVTECHIFRQGAAVEFGRDSAIGEDRLDLGAEQKRAPVPAIVKWLNSETISRRKKHTLAPIPDGKGEHAAQVLDAVAAVFLVKVNDGLGIAARAVAMSSGLKAGGQLGVVVDFSVRSEEHTS